MANSNNYRLRLDLRALAALALLADNDEQWLFDQSAECPDYPLIVAFYIPAEQSAEACDLFGMRHVAHDRKPPAPTRARKPRLRVTKGGA